MEFDKPKFGTKKWFENYWYHYKWHTIAGLFALFLVVTFIHDMVTQEKYDMELSVNSHTYISQEQADKLAEILERYVVDLDGDGVVNIGVFPNTFPENEGDAQMMMAAQTKFTVEISDGSSMILVLDDALYEMIGDPEFFADLSVYSDKAYDGGRKIKLKDTVLGADPALASLGDLFLTLRAPDSYAAAKNEKTRAAYQNQKQILENILLDHPTVSK